MLLILNDPDLTYGVSWLPFATSTKLRCSKWNAGHPRSTLSTDPSTLRQWLKYDCGSHNFSCLLKHRLLGSAGLRWGMRTRILVRSQVVLMWLVQEPLLEPLPYDSIMLIHLVPHSPAGCIFSSGSFSFGVKSIWGEKMSCLKSKQ